MNIRKAVFYIALVLGLTIGQSVSAATYTVGEGEEYDYATIQEAVDVAVDGDLVSVSAGTFEENIVVPGNTALILSGDDSGEGQTVIKGSVSFMGPLDADIPVLRNVHVIPFDSEYGVIPAKHIIGIVSETNLSVIDTAVIGGNTGIWMEEGSLDARNVTVRRAYKYGIFINDKASGIFARNVTAKKNRLIGIYIRGDYYGQIRNSRLTKNRTGLKIYNGENLTTRKGGIRGSVIRGNKHGIKLLQDSKIKRTRVQFVNNNKNIVRK